MAQWPWGEQLSKWNMTGKTARSAGESTPHFTQCRGRESMFLCFFLVAPKRGVEWSQVDFIYVKSQGNFRWQWQVLVYNFDHLNQRQLGHGGSSWLAFPFSPPQPTKELHSLNRSWVSESFFSRGFTYDFWRNKTTARWAPTNYKWSYKPYKWPYKWVTGVITLLIGVITPFITSRGPTLWELFMI